MEVAIGWGTGDWGYLRAKHFLSVKASPVLSSELYAKIGPFKSPLDLLRKPLLHFRNPSSGSRWFEASGVKSDLNPGETIFEDANVELQATLSGRGISMGNFPLIDDEIASGRLVKPFDTAIELELSYFLILPERQSLSLETKALIDWLLEQAS